MSLPSEVLYSGIKFPSSVARQTAELALFRDYAKLEKLDPSKGIYTGEGRLMHLKRIALELWKKDFIFHEWADFGLETCCDYKYTTIAGPTASGKTTLAALYACVWWLAATESSAVICTSTTLPGLKRRIWKEVKRFMLTETVRQWCDFNYVESKCIIQSKKGDDAHGIFGMAVAGGQTEKAIGRIIGFHPKRLLIIVDEMTDTPEAIVEACQNLSKTEGEFQFIGLGNAASVFDPHGKMSKPKDGWNSVNVDHDFWETADGACVHFDGEKSPNVKAGKNRFPWLLKIEDLEKDRKKYGENSPQFWRFDRGFWAPQGLESAIFTEAMCARFEVAKKAVWKRDFTNFAGLDPAYGGDRCILQLGRYGKAINGKTVIEFTETITIKIDAGIQIPIHFQIANQTREICKDRGVRPENCGIDSTGTGAGTADILAREWSPRIQRVNFANRPSERPVSENNPRVCREEYWNLRSEMWYSMRRFMEAEQLRGVSDEAAKEFCAGRYEMKGSLIALEPKDLMKQRTGFSPDIADAYVIGAEVVRRNGVQIEAGGFESPEKLTDDRRQERMARMFDVDSDSENYLNDDLSDLHAGSAEL